MINNCQDAGLTPLRLPTGMCLLCHNNDFHSDVQALKCSRFIISKNTGARIVLACRNHIIRPCFVSWVISSPGHTSAALPGQHQAMEPLFAQRIPKACVPPMKAYQAKLSQPCYNHHPSTTSQQLSAGSLSLLLNSKDQLGLWRQSC